MSDMFLTLGIDSFALAQIARELDRRDRDAETARMAAEEAIKASRFTLDDPNCVDHELPSRVFVPRTVTPPVLLLI